MDEADVILKRKYYENRKLVPGYMEGQRLKAFNKRRETRVSDKPVRKYIKKEKMMDQTDKVLMNWLQKMAVCSRGQPRSNYKALIRKINKPKPKTQNKEYGK